MSDWLDDAIKLNNLALDQKELVNEIDRSIINCKDIIGWMQRAIVLSYYYLLRHAKYLEAKKESQFYHDCIR